MTPDQDAEAPADRRPLHPDDPVGPALSALADDCGVATAYDDWLDRPTPVPAATVRAVLGLLGIDVPDEATAARALAERTAAAWARLVPPTVTARTGHTGGADLNLPAGDAITVEVHTEGGPVLTLASPVQLLARQGDRVRRRLVLPPTLPTGRHRLRVIAGPEQAEAVLLVAPTMLPIPDRRHWGWAVQLYATASSDSWGLGDYRDLARLAGTAGEQGAGLVLVNPLHALTPVSPIENSPYSPSSRRFRSVLHLAPAATVEYQLADEQLRAAVDALDPGPPGDRVDREAAWAARREAFDLLWPVARDDPDRQRALEQFRAEQGEGLVRHAVFCALAEQHGPDYHDWPQPLQDPTAVEVAEQAAVLADRVDQHAWQQLLCDEQLAQVAQAAAPTAIGIVHDLAVGVTQGGSDAWSLAGVLAGGASCGAPPDGFNQLGQDWALPPWRPDRLAETGYAAFADMVATTLRHAGGLRVDHVMGLFRLWWVPPGGTGAQGTYVSYDHEAMLTVLSLEAHRAGAVVVGEDLGTVQPWVRDVLAERGLLGSSVLWFETEPPDSEPPDSDQPDPDQPGSDPPGFDPVWLDPPAWRRLAMASVTTHDLPTAAGMLTDAHVPVRAELGLLAAGEPAERRRTAADRRGLLAMLVRTGLLDPASGVPLDGRPLSDDAHVRVVVQALHAALVAGPSLLVLAGLPDAVGDLRQPNLPGTIDEYPSWRLPVAGADGRTILLEQLLAHPGVAALAGLLADGLAGPGPAR